MGVKLDAFERILKVWKRTRSCHLDIDDDVVLKICRAMWSVVVPVPYPFISVTTKRVYRYCDSEERVISLILQQSSSSAAVSDKLKFYYNKGKVAM